MDNDWIKIWWWSYPLNQEHNVKKCVYKKHQKGLHSENFVFQYVSIRVVIIRDFKDGLVTQRCWSPRTDQIASCLPEIVCRFSGEDGVNWYIDLYACDPSNEIAMFCLFPIPSRMAWWWKSQKLAQSSTAPSVNRYYQMADAAMFAEVCLPSYCTHLSCMNRSFFGLTRTDPPPPPEVNTATLPDADSGSIPAATRFLSLSTWYEFFLAGIAIRADWSVCFRAPAMPICLYPAALARRYYGVNSHQ